MLPLRIFASLQIDNRNFLLPVDGQMFVFGNLHHLLGWFRNSSEIKLIKKKKNPNHCFLSSCDGSFSKQTWKKKKNMFQNCLLLTVTTVYQVPIARDFTLLCSSWELYCSPDVSGSGKWTALFWKLQWVGTSTWN